MILKYNKLKYTLLKYFRNMNIVITLNEAVETSIYIENAKILIDNKKICLSDGNDRNFIINFNYIEKIKIVNKLCIILQLRDITIQIEQ